jgi:class 3 adenylate cyclase/predicted ATPase/ABC-type transport system involved in cytochrome c biogenesis ATPase subunit
VCTQWAHGERRQLTVLTCDLVNSVELSTRFDPEELAEVISSYQSCCESVIGELDGYVARFTGDGLKAYFGYPRAHEYDPERAVRAGLALVSAVRRLKPRPGLVLSIRVGIATGDVVVGEVIGAGEAQERTVAGQAPNLAARLQGLAEPASVVIADTTKLLIGSLYEYADLGRNQFKGFPEPIQAWRVLAEGPTKSHFEAVRSEANLSPIVGRDEELTFLRHRWLQVKAGKGQTVLLSGEAGIGKSRLTVAFRRSLIDGLFTDLRYYCSPYHQNSSFYPIVGHLEHAARFSSTDTPGEKLDKLENFLSELGLDVVNVAPPLALLLSIPTNDRYPLRQISPGQQRRLVLHTLEAAIIKLASPRPLLMVFEDVHWIDPSTRELLDRLIRRVPGLPVLLVMTCRSDFKPTVELYSRLTTRVLDRLPRRQCELIVGFLDPHSTLSSGTLDQILDYSEGLPLFLEELTKSALEAEHEQGMRRHHAANSAPVSAIRVPRTLHDSLLARLDRLGPRKRVAQTAAVIGRRFTFKLLAALLPQDHATLAETLQGLVQSELIVEQGKSSEATYTYTHALLQEAASACLLNADRREIHLRVARALELEFPDIVKSEPELLALHYTRAGLMDPAIGYWRQAAEQALLRSANAEAAHHLEQALALLGTMPESSARDQRELPLQTRLGATLTTVKGFAAPQVAAAYERARLLCREWTGAGQRFSVLRGLWVCYLVRAEWQSASDLAEEMLDLAKQEGDPGFELEAHRALGMTLLWRGAFMPARHHVKQGFSLYDSEQHRSHVLNYGNDPGIACLVHEALALWMLGYPDRALATSLKALTLARRLAHPFSLTQALIYTTFIHQWRGEAPLIRPLSEEAKTLAAEHGFPFWLAEATIMEGWAVVEENADEDGIVQLRKGLADFLATGARMDRPRWLALLAEVCERRNRTQDGLTAVSEALTVVVETKECLLQARLCQLKGELVLKEGLPGAAERAEACFQEALLVARSQQAKSWELRAATSLARLWYAQSRRRAAYELLAPVYGWFTEGFDTADVKEAKVLLDELA